MLRSQSGGHTFHFDPGQASAVADWFRHETIGCTFCPWEICGRHSDEVRLPHTRNAASTEIFRRVEKGYQGVMKRWGFGSQPASHGPSISHRSAGATRLGLAWYENGGPYGRETAEVTQSGSRAGRELPRPDLIFVKGHLPGTGGSRGAVVFVRDAVKKLISACV
jgi:hypothetical protein